MESAPWALCCSIKTSFTQSEQLRSGEGIGVWLFGQFVCLFIYLGSCLDPKIFFKEEGYAQACPGLEADEMMGGRPGKRVAFVAHRVHTTLRSDERVKGHFKSLHRSESAPEYYMEH